MRFYYFSPDLGIFFEFIYFWPNLGQIFGGIYFLQNFGNFLLIYTVNPYYFCIFFHKNMLFVAFLFFTKFDQKYRVHLFCARSQNFGSGATIVGGVNYNTLVYP